LELKEGRNSTDQFSCTLKETVRARVRSAEQTVQHGTKSEGWKAPHSTRSLSLGEITQKISDGKGEKKKNSVQDDKKVQNHGD